MLAEVIIPVGRLLLSPQTGILHVSRLLSPAAPLVVAKADGVEACFLFVAGKAVGRVGHAHRLLLCESAQNIVISVF